MESRTGAEHSWVARPWVAGLMRATAYLVPILTALVAAALLAAQMPSARTAAGAVAGWIAVAAASTVVLVATERITRRLLPLSTLFTLTLAFPDRVPSRFRIAIRVGTAAQLRRRIEEVRRGEVGDTPGEVAERLLELVGLLSKHDRMTRGHSERVRGYSHIVGAQMGLSGPALDRLRWAALLHDIGKLMVSAEVLNKRGRLTDEEFAEIKTHPMAGRELVEPLAGWLGDSVRAVWEHHERFDGGGYPQGLAGEDISLAARIVCVTDAYDVMTSTRSYKQPMKAADARRELSRCAGSQFDPQVVRAFLSASLGRVEARSGPVAWVAQAAMFPRTIAAQLAGTMATGAAIGVGVVSGVAGVVAAAESLDREVEFLAELPSAPSDDPGVPATDASSAGGGSSSPVPLIESGTSPDADVTDGPILDDGGVPIEADDTGPAGPPSPVDQGGDVVPVVTIPGAGPGSPSVTVPPVTVPPLPGTNAPTTVPPVTVPPVTVPGTPVTVPGTTVPVPPVTVPVTGTPVTVPGTTVTVPPVTVPGTTVTVPPVTVPGTTVTVPPVTTTVPPVTVPPVTTLPPVPPPTTVPPVTAPPTTLPPVTVPSLG